MKSQNSSLRDILTDSKLAQFGDSLLNFAYSLALTRSRGKPVGVKVTDKVLAKAAAKTGLRQYLPKRINTGDVANSLEALVGHAWLTKQVNLDEIVTCLTPGEFDSLDPSNMFVRLAMLALGRLLDKQE